MGKKVFKLSKNERLLWKWIFIALVASLISTTVIDTLIFLTLDGLHVVAPNMFEFKTIIIVVTLFINFTSIMTSFILFEDKEKTS